MADSIKLRYSSVDGYSATKAFKTLAGARAFAHRMVGEFPEMGSTYAVSGDGVGKIVVRSGCKLRDLFSAEAAA